MKRFCLWIGLVLACSTALAEELPAELDWSRRVTLGTPVSGVIVQVTAKAAQSVKKGELLARLDDRGLQAQVRRNEADVARLKLSKEEAQREFERAQALYERTVISERDRQLAQIALSVANAEYQAALAGLTQAQIDLEYSRIIAPFDGIVLIRHVEPGQTVANNLSITPLITLADNHSMLAKAWVDATRIASLSPGQALEVHVADTHYSGHIDHLGLEAQTGEQGPRYALWVRFSGAGTRLRAGQRASISLP